MMLEPIVPDFHPLILHFYRLQRFFESFEVIVRIFNSLLKTLARSGNPKQASKQVPGSEKHAKSPDENSPIL